MNKPIRTISVFCLLLFLALMLNATYLQYWRAGALNEDPRNRRVLAESFSSERGAILVGEAGQGRTPIAESEPSGDQYDFQRQYPAAPQVRPPHRLVLLLQPDRAGEHPELRAVRRRLAAVRHPAGRPAQQLQRQGRQRAADHRPGRRRRPRSRASSDLGEGVEGSVVAIEPSSGRILAMASLPTYDPNELASHDFGAGRQAGRGARRARRRAAAQPRHLDPAAPRLDVQAGDRRRGHRVRQLRRRLAGARRRDLPAAADHRRQRPDRQRGPRLRHHPDPVHPGDGPVLQHHLRPARGRGRRRRDARAGRGVRVQQRLPRGPAQPGPVDLPRGHEPARDRPERDRPVRGRRHPAADGDGLGRDRQRRHRDAALPRRRRAHPRARRAAPHRARGAVAGRRRPRPRRTSPS